MLECSPVRLALARRGCVSGGRAFKNRLLTRALPAFASGFQQPGAGPCFLALPRGGRASASPRSRVSGVPWPWVSSGQAFPPRFVLVSCSQGKNNILKEKINKCKCLEISIYQDKVTKSYYGIIYIVNWNHVQQGRL